MAESSEELDQLPGGQESPPRILLLTSSLGSGHLMASTAVAAALRESCPSIEIETVDFWSLMDQEVAAAVRHAYLDMLSTEPQLYDSVYRLDQHIWRSLFDAELSLAPALETFIDHFSVRIEQANDIAPDTVAGTRRRSDRLLLRQIFASLARRRRHDPAIRQFVRPALFRWVWATLCRRLEQRLMAFEPHAAVATQMGPAALLAWIKHRRNLALPLIAVPTDFGIHDFWLQKGIGCYCVAHESVVHSDLPAGSLLRATGIPLMPAFRRLPERDEARAELGLPAARPIVLVAGGGLGLGVGELSARILAAAPEATVVALTGRNAAAQASLHALASSCSDRLVICEWTDCMPSWLRASDLVVGKPGGLTVAESLACGRFLLAVRSPGGQEGFNVRFLEHHGVGAMVRDEELGERLQALLADPVELHALQARAAALGRSDGAARIAALAFDAVHGTQVRAVAGAQP
jgi:UDP-N-acetylglucosamine:LPS N-acetylglucosamine transferase